MKFIKVSFLVSALFISCNNKVVQEKNIDAISEIKTPSIERNKNDVNFKLINGILFYEDVLFAGIVNDFYIDGSLKSKATYYQGKKEGKFFGYYPDKKKWFERYYHKGLKVKTHKGWFQNGQQMFVYQLNNNGVYNGSVKDWHYNGQLAKHFNFINGKEEGSQKMWTIDGKIKANFFTIDNERHGLIGLKKCVSVLTTDKN
ncbi:MAG: hypothetical protein ABJH82_07110 [Polaribacter sp.]|uniref:toxin-antitoxin system YwqK family antitoxin n=1 Tax=Polaribacter sp. TaxID=1920175 RepID=UPI00326747D4